MLGRFLLVYWVIDETKMTDEKMTEMRSLPYTESNHSFFFRDEEINERVERAEQNKNKYKNQMADLAFFLSSIFVVRPRLVVPPWIDHDC